MAKPTVAASLVKAFLDFAVSRGANQPALIKQSRISTDELKEPDNRIALSNYLALLQAAIELCNEPALSLLFGEAVRMQDVSVVGMIGEQAPSVESARRQINRFARLMLDEDDGETSDRIEFIRDGGDVWVKFTSRLYIEYPLLTESAIARCVCGGREAFEETGVVPFPKAIHFTYAEPSYRVEYDRVFRVPLFFNSRMNALVVDEAFLSFKQPQTNPFLSQILTAHAEELLEDLERSKSTRGSVERLLIPILHTGEASVDMIASKIGVSRQTLFRKLKTEGVTFEQVLDELRYKLACEYLNRKGVSVNQTAYLLGFSEPAAFSRAFKRWTGSSPRMMRSKN